MECSSPWLHFRKLPKKGVALKSVQILLKNYCAQFGTIVKFVVLHGRGQALVEFSDCSSSFRLLEFSGGIIALAGWEHQLHVALGEPRIKLDESTDRAGRIQHDSEIVNREVTRALEALIRDIVTNDSKDRHIARQLRKRNHKQLLNSIQHNKFTQSTYNQSLADGDHIKVTSTSLAGIS